MSNHIITKDRLVIGFLLILCVIFLIPVLMPGIVATDDGSWMVIRLTAFYQSFREGQFPVRVLGRLNNNFGYPVANFLYPGYLYVGSVLHAIGISFQSAIDGIVLLSMMSAAVWSYLWFRIYFKIFPSMIASICVIVHPYFLYDIYTRGSIGEILAIGCIFCVFYALDTGKKRVFVPAFVMLLLSHNISALLFVCIVLLYAIWTKRFDIIGPFLLAIGISSFFWLPALVEQKFVLFQHSLISDSYQYFPKSLDLILKSLPLLLFAGISIIVRNSSSLKTRATLFILILFISGVLMTTISYIFWGEGVFRTYIQFPYRLNLFWIIAGPWVIAYVLSSINSKTLAYIVGGALCVWFFVTALPIFHSTRIEYPDSFYSTNEGTTTVANEYMPRWVSTIPTKRADNKLEVYKGNMKIHPQSISTNSLSAQIESLEDGVLQINTIYYPGWGAMVDNRPVTISYANDSGVMRVSIPKGFHQLYMAFRETKSRFIVDIFLLYVL